MAGQGCVLVSWEPRVAVLPGHATCPVSGRELLFVWLVALYFLCEFPVFFLAKTCNLLFSKMFVFSLLPTKEPRILISCLFFTLKLEAAPFRVDF